MRRRHSFQPGQRTLPSIDHRRSRHIQRYLHQSILDRHTDFDFCLACVLAPNLNDLVKEKRLSENTIVKLENVVHNLTSTGK